MNGVKELLRVDWEYSAWATRRVLDACSGLTDEERKRDLGHSHASVLSTLQHIYEGDWFWSRCMRTNHMPPLAEIGPEENPPEPRFENLLQVWPEVWDSTLLWLDSVEERDLASLIASQLPSGQHVAFTPWQLSRHCVNHSTLHRGQIIGMLRTLGRRPPNLDLMGFYLRQERC